MLGSSSLVTDSSGNASFSLAFPTPNGGARFVTATATDSSGNTSEFSLAFGVDHPPLAKLSFSSTTVNEGTPVAFDGTGSFSPDGDQLTYTWSFGDGATATGPAPTHTYTAPGTDQVLLTVNDGFGGVSSVTAAITVVDVPPVFTPNSFTSPETYAALPPAVDLASRSHQCSETWRLAHPTAGGSGAVEFFDGVPTDDGVEFDLQVWRIHPCFQ